MSSVVRSLVFTLALCAIASHGLTTGASAADVDVEIVLAVDASGSVDKSELQLQLDGIAAAFRDQGVQEAIVRGPLQRVSASLLIWSDAGFGKYPTEWHLLDSPTAANAFATRVEDFRQTTAGYSAIGGGGTGLGDGLYYALQMIKSNGVEASRRIVDISGDGIETPPWNQDAVELPAARAAAIAGDVTVNGLAIINEVPNLAAWYRDNVAVGPNSFVLETSNFQDFTDTIKIKLLREFSDVPIGSAPSKSPRSLAQK